MFASVFTAVSGLLSKRFVLNALFPTILFGIGLLFVWQATGRGIAAGVNRLNGLNLTALSVITILSVAVLLVGATLLSSQSQTLLSWMQGTSGPFSWTFLANPGKKFWEARRQDKDTSSPDFAVPRKDADVAPTALGTLGYANAEYIWRNYGIDLAVIWPRLSVLLPAQLANQIEEAEAAIEQLVAFSTAAILFGLIAGGIAAYHRMPIIICVLLPLASYILAFLVYRAVLPAAQQWSQLVRTGVDLHRFELLDALHLPHPRTSAEYRVLWKRLNGILLGQELDRSLGFVAEED
jgi:hypothetical protein